MRTKNVGINIRVDEKEKRDLERKAKKSGLSLSAYLRKVGLEKEIYPIPDEEFYNVYSDICKVKNAIDETLPIEKIKQCLEIISNEFLDIYNSCFPIEYFPKSVGMILTYLCTYDNHLTQGSPTSAYISNLVMKEFDEELGNWCNLRNISYTRYSDDMTFSGAFNPSELITKVRKMLYKLGLELNNDKIHIVYKSSSQNVTGIVVNEKMQVNVKYRNKIRQEIYYIKKFGLSSHLKKCDINIDSKRYLNILYGRVLYVLQINENDKEFIKYRQFIENLKRQCKS